MATIRGEDATAVSLRARDHAGVSEPERKIAVLTNEALDAIEILLVPDRGVAARSQVIKEKVFSTGCCPLQHEGNLSENPDRYQKWAGV